MPNCENCHYKWSFFETMKIGFASSKKCPNCGAKQYVSTKSSKTIYIIYLIPLFIIVFVRPLLESLGVSSILSITLVVLFIIAYIFYIPYTIRLSNEQEPLW
ncbi:TIGR04104 family putative zinc finger protein [Jeotgalibacillus terrae]|uniref:TIGR04104 family putative zinc finger protein n=1 Tax=Jeotgalibacillus terrae TaxID=587735 RepID=A0ABW5ZJV4_9BACL|nr:TIGR04104 family putative zinc finger protein [Jeotgalibacillus terrae]MBM7578618.1 CXXC-20-CXXC protein [Jeotgalibacillus terrae]